MALLLLAMAALLPSAARAQGQPPGCTGSGLGILLFTDAGDTHIGDTIHYSVTINNGAGVGPVVCDARDITAFVVTPDGVSHPVALVRTLLHNGESDYYTNVVAYVVRAQDIQPDGTVRATAQDTGTILQNDTNSQGGANQGVNTEISQPCIRLNAVCVAGTGESGLITFSGSITNCGNNTLFSVAITNSVNGGQFHVTVIPVLARGQSATFSGSWIPLNPCAPSVATLVATGIDGVLRPRTVTSSTTITCSNLLTPGIQITKSCPAGPVRPGQLLTFSGSVSNSGNVTLTNIVVVNNRPAAGTPVFTLPSLAPGTSATFSGSYFAPTNCTVADTLSVAATSLCGTAVANSATATCPILTTPQIAVTATCPTSPILPGGTLTYVGTVRNTGDVTLSDIVITSDRPAAGTRIFSVASLAPGASATYSATTAVPAGACAVPTTIAAAAKDACTGVAASHSTTITCPVLTAPGLALTLSCPPSAPAAGGPITYSGTVRNSGNVALNDVTVRSGPSATDPIVLTIPILAPGATTPFTATQAAPADACSYVGSVTASGSDACTSAPVTASTSATCPLATTPQIAVTQACPTSPPGPSGVLTYSGTVRNAGTVTLTNIVVTADRTGSTPVFTLATLAPGEVGTFTGTYTVPAGSGCSITATLTAGASSRCTGARISSTAPATCPVVGAPGLAVTIACPTTPTPLGGVLSFSGTVRNTGNTTLTNVVVRRDGAPAAATPVFAAATLAPGATATFGGSYQAPATDTCSIVTALTANANDPCGGIPVAAIAAVECPLVATPRLVVAQFCPTTQGIPGALLTTSGSVSNAGNVTLTNVVILASQPAPNTVVFTAATLAPGASAAFEHAFVAPPDACSVSSTLSVSGQSRCNGAVASHTATSTCPLTVTPGLAVTRDCPVSPVLEGATLVYAGSVRNTGNVTLTNVTVFSRQPAANTRVFGPISLAPGAITNFTGSFTAPLNVCSIEDTLTATGRERCTSTSVTNTVTGSCPITTVPRIGVTLVCPATPAATGTPILYTGTVRNLGNVTLNGVTVVDAHASPPTVLSLPSLAPGASAAFTSSFLAPADACAVDTTVVATGFDACSSVAVSANASATCPLRTTPRLVVTQDCPPSPATLGGILLYTGSVRNTGDITLTNVTVTHAGSGSTPIFAAATLAPGATAAFTGSFAVPADAGCSITTTLTGAGFDTCSAQRVTSTSTITCPVTGTAGISITQECPTTTVEPGSLLRYTGIVVNRGNLTLTNIVVTSTRPGSNTVVFTTAILAPGASAAFAGSYLVPVDCCVVSSTVRVTANPICPGPTVGDSDTAICTVAGSPALVVTKVCPTAPVRPGSPMDFTGTVRNSGSVTLVEVTVVNNLIGPTPLLGPVTLAPGETLAYSGTYILPADFCGPDTVTARGLNACTFAAVTGTAIVPCPIINTPAISVTKSCPATMASKGGLFTFTGTVRNTGDITLKNVRVTNSKPARDTLVIGPINLAPGESADFSGSYTAAACCCETVDTLTARGQSRCNDAEVVATSTVVCPLLPTPILTIVRNCPTTPVPAGGLFTYTGTISNLGDVTLTNVTVLPSMPLGSTPILGPIDLGAGETKSFTASYTVAAGSDPTTDTVTVRGQEACQGRLLVASADCLGPVSPVVRITAVSLAGSTANVTWSATPGGIYALQWNSGQGTVWTDVDGTVTAPGASASKSHPAEPMTHRFYRVKVLRD